MPVAPRALPAPSGGAHAGQRRAPLASRLDSGQRRRALVFRCVCAEEGRDQWDHCT